MLVSQQLESESSNPVEHSVHSTASFVALQLEHPLSSESQEEQPLPSANKPTLESQQLEPDRKKPPISLQLVQEFTPLLKEQLKQPSMLSAQVSQPCWPSGKEPPEMWQQIVPESS